MEEQTSILLNIFSVWSKEDKQQFKKNVSDAFYKKIDKDDIIKFLEKKRDENSSINDDFEQWAYLYIVSGGMSDCPPG